MKSAAIRFYAVASAAMMTVTGVSQAQEISPAASKAEKKDVIEFKGDDVSLALRKLARDAGVNIIVSTQVKGTISLHIAETTPKEAIEIIANSNDLRVDEIEGIMYVRTEAEVPKSGPMFDQIAITRMAKFKWRYYKALLDVGFSKDAALKIITSEPAFSKDNFPK